jgi:hypothetical protein
MRLNTGIYICLLWDPGLAQRRCLKGRPAIRLWIAVNATRQRTRIIVDETNSSINLLFE